LEERILEKIKYNNTTGRMKIETTSSKRAILNAKKGLKERPKKLRSVTTPQGVGVEPFSLASAPASPNE